MPTLTPPLWLGLPTHHENTESRACSGILTAWIGLEHNHSESRAANAGFID